MTESKRFSESEVIEINFKKLIMIMSKALQAGDYVEKLAISRQDIIISTMS